MHRKAQWQVVALVLLAVLWLGWRWYSVYDTRTFTAPEAGNGEIEDGGEIPAWADLPGLPEFETGDESDLASARLERERARSLIIEVLGGIAADPKTDEEMRREAQRRLIAMAEAAAREREIEQLLRSQGWEQVLCYVYPGSALIVTPAREITPAEAARIMDVVASVTALDWDDITVIAAGGE